MGNYENKVADRIYTTGVIYLILSVLGAFLIPSVFEDFGIEIGFTIILAVLIYSFIFSLIFFGAAEVIELLHQQNKKTEELIRIQKNSSQPNESARQKPVLEDFEDLPDL